MTHLPNVVVELIGGIVLPNDARRGFSAVGTVADVVTVNGQPPALSYRVRAMRESDGGLVAETWSAAGTGAYTFTDLDTSERYIAVALDHTGTHKPVAAGPLVPMP
ncbi:hypothetical protein [Ottowia sp. SB7-C50]|uniref:hypothetical protein n=1 Tax=Ottowia sp. SB7-C50 TaxID=3081231 RepID=UPI002953DD6B|nr:hypothetical protein [Ottowia sp. SB7-C50]WOP15762.1 hypothetical protein R0D99_01410 [Ottowia sp. SB7-C50]